MNFDPLQRAVLGELGLVTYRHVGGESGAVDIAPELLARLARAAGVSEAHLLEQPRLLAQAAKMGDDPRAKRALWPLLRVLRRDPQ